MASLSIIRIITFIAILTITQSRNLRINDKLNSRHLMVDEEIDDSFLQNSFDEMEKNLEEEEYKIVGISQSKGILSDMLLEEVNCLEKKLAGVHCSSTTQ